MPKKNKLGYWKREVLDQLAILLGGRAAEETFLNDMSSGAQHDIMQATRLARSMICEWGMSDKLGTITYDDKEDSGRYLGMSSFHEKKYSEETAQKIDEEVYKLIEEAHKRAKMLVEENREKIELMAEMLMEFETLYSEDINEIMDGSWEVSKKKDRLKLANDLNKKPLPPPPPPSKRDDSDFNLNPQEG